MAANAPAPVATTEQQNPNAVELAVDAPITTVVVAGRGEVQRIETEVILPSGFQYLIKGKGRDVPNKVGITSDGYDYLNRVMGVMFWMPTVVPDETGQLVRNPIHRADGYVYLRMAGTWWNEVGQMVSTFEDIEVNPRAIWASARIESYGAVPVMKDGQPVFDEYGYPMVVMRDTTSNWDGKSKTTTAAEHEQKAAKAYMQARGWGIRYAQTVARVRIMKQATGMKSLGQLTQPKRVRVRVVGYKDAMTPMERVEASNAALASIFGERVKPENFERMTAEEMEAMEPMGGDETIEQELGEAAANDEVEPDEGEPTPPDQPGQATLLPDDEFSVPGQ